MARELKGGDTIRTLGGHSRVVTVIQGEVQPVFNLEVFDGKSFFVGKRAPSCTTTRGLTRSFDHLIPSLSRSPRSTELCARNGFQDSIGGEARSLGG